LICQIDSSEDDMSDEGVKVVIIGEGFGGIETAKALGRAAVHGQGLKKVAATGLATRRLHKTCPCQEPAEDRDLVFVRYAPTP
jgi:hypothetical protein